MIEVFLIYSFIGDSPYGWAILPEFVPKRFETFEDCELKKERDIRVMGDLFPIYHAQTLSAHGVNIESFDFFCHQFEEIIVDRDHLIELSTEVLNLRYERNE